jgi:omega-amidase
MRVRLLQIATDNEELQENRVARVLDMINSGSNSGALLILPEHWITGAFASGLDLNLSVRLYSYFLKKAQDICHQKNISLISGSGLTVSNDRTFTNTSYFISPAEPQPIPYSKVHKFRIELGNVVAGESVQAFEHLGYRVSTLICYDLRFPESFRQRENYASDIYIVVAAWPKSRIDVWLHLLKARALENQCFVIGVNGVGKQGQEVLGGQSRVLTPTGEEIAVAGAAEESLEVVLDRKYLDEHRSAHSYLEDSRFLTFWPGGQT